MTNTEAEPTNIPPFEQHHRLARALEWSGVTPAEMAAELGVHVNSVHNYASGRRLPKRAVISVWALKTGVPREWLEHGIEPGSNGPDDEPRTISPHIHRYAPIHAVHAAPFGVAA